MIFKYLCDTLISLNTLYMVICNLLRRFLAVIPALVVAVACPAAPMLPDPEPSWKNVTVDGQKTAVFCLYGDSRGIMWLGSNRGLYFYDGVTTHAVGGSDLAGAQIYAIAERNDSLLLGSNNGLLVYDYRSGRVSHANIPTPTEIRALLLADDCLWIGSLGGIRRIDLRTRHVEDLSAGLPHKSVYSLLRDSRGILYVGTYAGPARWDPQRRRFDAIDVTPATGRAPGRLFANCLLESADHRCIYLGSEGTLYRYEPARDLWETVPAVEGNTIKSLANGEAGHLLVGTDNGVYDLSADGLRHYRHDSRLDLSLADNEIWCIYADSRHNIWTGHERGFSIASGGGPIRRVKLGTLTNSGEGNEIHHILRDSRGELWLGGTNGVLRLTDSGSPRWYRHGDRAGSLSHNRIRAISEDSRGTLWFATDAGINRHREGAGDSFEVYRLTDSLGHHNSNWVYALVESGDHLWAGSFLGGLHYVPLGSFGDGGGTIVSERSLNSDTRLRGEPLLSNDLVNNVVIDRAGNLWILLFRDNMLSCWNPAGDAVRRYDVHAMTGGYPTHLDIDSRGRIWCAFTGGAVIFAPGAEPAVVRFPHTGSDETILAMGAVDDGMWISTQSNVWSLAGDGLSPTLLPIPQNSYTAVYQDPAADRVMLGGCDELLEVDRTRLDSGRDYKSIRMVLDDRGDGLNLADIRRATAGLTIPYGGGVSLVVSTLDYSPESIQRYMYKLAESPADTVGGWVVMPEGANTITFSDLKMGDYTVLVRTVGAPVSPVAVPLRVNRPAALSWWAITIYIVLALAGVCWIVWYTRRRNLRAFREQERQTALENVEKKLTFLSTISHDFKTPLSMIMGPVSVLKERTRDPESRKTLEAVYDNAVRLNNMIHRTLELQHLEDADESLLILSTFDAVDFCRGIFEIFRDNNPQKHFVFHTSCPQVFIEADAVKFESVITNLLSNACKYSDERATISCGISRSGGRVEIVVSDDGVGISAADQGLVFQRMFRSPATSGLREGTGLGLYLIKKYLDLMHGTIDLYSREGEGTTFVVTLPCSEQVQQPTAAGTDEGAAGRPKILVVEDNVQISGFIRDLLRGDYTVLTAENGRSGLAIASSFAPDLIIADEMMPIMTGLDMVRRLKQNPRLAAVPLIMLTAKSDNTTENESIKLGIDVFMAKPFEPAALLGRIAQLLRSRSEIREKVRIQAIAEAQERPIEAESATEKSLARIARVIEENISDPDLNVNLLCEKTDIPNKQLYRLIKKYIGLAPLDYIRSVRLQKAAVLLSQHRFTVSEISYMVGFKTPSYFAKCFQSQYGVKPSQYRSDDESKI